MFHVMILESDAPTIMCDCPVAAMAEIGCDWYPSNQAVIDWGDRH